MVSPLFYYQLALLALLWLFVPEVTNGRGSARVWRPCTPAMVAGLTDHVWTLKEVLLYRVPPWPHPQAR